MKARDYTKKILKPFLILTGFMMSLTAYAEAEWASQQSLKRVYASSSSVYIQTNPNGDHINPGGCSKKASYGLDPDATMFDKQYQALLTALAAGKKVSLKIDGCLGNYPRITGVII